MLDGGTVSGFEAGRRVAVCRPDLAGRRDRRPSDGERSAREALCRALAYIVDSRNPAAAGRRATALGWMLGVLPDIGSQEALAARLGVTPARASKLISEVRNHFTGTA